MKINLVDRNSCCKSHLVARRSRRTGFTLTELLVSISVIAVLASLLFMGVGQLKKRSRAATCMGNLKQLGIAINLYASDNNGVLPPLVNPGSDVQSLWPKRIWMYLLPETPYKDYGGVGLPKEFNETVFECPEACDDRPPTEVIRSYAYNYLVRDGNRLTADRIIQISRPEQVCLIADSKQSSDLFFSQLNPRHSKKCNGLFLDGHVSAFEIIPEMFSYAKHPFWGINQ